MILDELDNGIIVFNDQNNEIHNTSQETVSNKSANIELLFNNKKIDELYGNVLTDMT